MAVTTARLFINKSTKVYILIIGIMDNKSARKLISNTFSSFTEFERDMIIEFT
ncbi:hypothetical protein [Peribacillus sp. SCS-155]|uniref:hypothetical protein n=1 Tax=Peribacillus sedimenti TaxID=3115297 RepID=UPI00390612B7